MNSDPANTEHSSQDNDFLRRIRDQGKIAEPALQSMAGELLRIIMEERLACAKVAESFGSAEAEQIAQKIKDRTFMR